MKFKTTLAFVLLTIVFSSCNIVKYSSTHQPLAKYYSFGSDTSQRILPILDTTHMYVMGQDLVKTYRNGKTEKFFGYTFLKFSTNGIAFYSAITEEKPNSTNIYTVEGQYCFFKVIDEEVRLELYDYHLKKFTIIYLKVFPDKLIAYKDKLRIWGGGTSKFNETFIKSDILYTRHLQFPE